MEDVSDPPFRALCKQYGADMMYTEFVSSEGLIRHAKKSVEKLDIFEYERPIGIQIFGDSIDSMRRAAALAEEAEPDCIDINYGCPVKKVACKGAGAGILLDLPKMQRMTRAIVEAVSVPVTVKTRLGWDAQNIRITEAALRLQEAGIQALTIHGRTRQQMYKGEADWTYIAAVKAHPEIKIPIFGNGDIHSPEKAWAYKEKYGVDGLMIGRSAIGNPWIFDQIKYYFRHNTLPPSPPLSMRVEALRKHAEFSVKWKGERRGLLELRRHYAHYLRDIPQSRGLRTQLTQTQSLQEFEDVLQMLDPLCSVS